MEYSSSILSKIPADWSVVGGSITSSSIFLGVGGYATLELLPKDIKTIPASMQLYILASRFDSSYVPSTFATLRVVSENDVTYTYSAPISETVSGISSTVLQLDTMKYKKCYFTISTEQPITITEWLLSPPVVEEIDPVDIEDLKKEIPKLLADYNVAPITVQQKETTVALISFMLTSNTDISGHLQASFYASHDGVVTFRFVDNDGIELFAPIHRLVQNGYNTVGVPHSYLKRKLGIHTFIVSAQVNIGTLTFGIRDILFTIDAGYLAKRTMDVGLDLQDIALCQLPGETEPSSIYAIGIDEDGIARVRKRVYSTDASIVWEPVFNIATASKAAIEFDGTFVRRTGDEYFTLECETVPWVFWINASGQVVANKGPITENSTITLSTGPATDLSVVRGYKSTLFPQQDQGIICSYIKAGKVYYRNYCLLPNETYGWDEEQSLTQLGTSVTAIQVHRLNDFRVGFAASIPTGNKWLISDRTYVAASVPTETVYLNTRLNSAIALRAADTADIKPIVTISLSEDKYKIYIDSTAEWVLKGSFYVCFEYDATMDFRPEAMSAQGHRITITLSNPLDYGTVTLTPNAGYILTYLPNEGLIYFEDSLLLENYIFKRQDISAEVISISTQITSTVSMIYAGPIEHTQPIIFDLNAQLNSSVDLIAVSIKEHTQNTTIAINAQVTSSVQQIHTSDIPV